MFRLSLAGVSEVAAEAGRRRSLEAVAKLELVEELQEDDPSGDGVRQDSEEPSIWSSYSGNCMIRVATAGLGVAAALAARALLQISFEESDEGTATESCPGDVISEADTEASAWELDSDCPMCGSEGLPKFSAVSFCSSASEEEVEMPIEEESEKDVGEEQEEESDEESDVESEESEDEEEQEPPRHRRSMRSTRKSEEKTTHWKIVNLPEFQDWAKRCHFHQEALPVPPSVIDIANGDAPLPDPEARLPQSRKVKKRSTVRKLPSEEAVVGRKDSQGVLVPFVRLGRTCTAEETCTSMAAELDRVEDAIKKRANGEVMPLLVQSVISRTRMRFGTDPGLVSLDGTVSVTIGGFAAAKKDVAKEANKFDRSYARVRESIESFASFMPLRRNHTVSLGECLLCNRTSADQSCCDVQAH